MYLAFKVARTMAGLVEAEAKGTCMGELSNQPARSGGGANLHTSGNSYHFHSDYRNM
jgi:hypothetical protein